MACWRDVLGFRPDEAMDFETAHQRYRQIVVRLAANGCPIEPRALKEAIEEARLELLPPNDADYMPEGLLASAATASVVPLSHHK